MNEYIVTRFSPYAYPQVDVKTVTASDISQGLSQAMNMLGWPQNEIISIKLNLDKKLA